MIGQIVGNYKIEEKLGEGGMGAVYKGVDTMLDREVAIKALRPELASQTSIVERFRSEAVTLAKLNHPNIATLYSLFRQGEELYMVLEFVRGETLDNIMQTRGAMSSEEAIPVFCQVLDGICHAHDFGIVHRDIKPANMMLTENGTLKVLDFGIARLLGSARMTRAGNIIGTLEYMAPEQVKGQETDARSDIYALGMMLYEVLTGRLPFESENEFELMKMQTEQIPQSPREINADIPETVEAAIMRAIQKDPDARFQDAGEFLQTLLDAGYSTSGAMHGATGNYHIGINSNNSRPGLSSPGVSRSGISRNDEAISAESAPETPEIKATRLGAAASILPSASEKEIKATRLGASAATAASAASTSKQMKATRLGAMNPPIAVNPAAATENNNSFLSNLTMVHYAGAGIAGVFLLGLLIAVPLLFLGGSSNAADVKTEEKPKIEEKKPEVVTMPNQPPLMPVQSPAVTTSEVKPDEKTIADINIPAPEAKAPAKTASKSAAKPEPQKPAKRETAKTKKPSAPAPPKKEKKSKLTQKDLDFLTGN